MKKLNGVTDNLVFLVWSWVCFSMAWSFSPNDHATTTIWCILFTALVTYNITSAVIRYRKVRRFADRKEFVYLGDTLPKNLSISWTSFAVQNYSISSCIFGELRGISLAIFDLSYRSGKKTIVQTVVAFPRSGPNAIAEPPFDIGGPYEFEEAGDWIIAWVPRRVVKIEELEDWCIELHALASDLLAEGTGETETRPRLFRWMT